MTKTAARSWLRQQSAAARPDGVVVFAAGFFSVAFGVLQAIAAATVLAEALAPDGRNILHWLGVFVLAAVARASLGVASEYATMRAGARARRRIRDDAMERLLSAGPAMLRTHHSAALAAQLVDRIEAVDLYFGRYLPATWLAVAGPVLVLLATLFVDPLAAALLALCGIAVPFLMALAGIGAGRAASRQFVAMTRLQARFLDRVRGIATLVLLGRAEDEARALAVTADELRRRTMRVLRIAFLSSAGMDALMALVLVLVALRYGTALMQIGQSSGLPSESAVLSRGLLVLLLVPEFFAPLRSYTAAYQDGLQARAAAEELCNLPARAEPLPASPTRTINARSLTVVFDNVTFAWDETRGPALDGVSFRAQAGETLLVAGPSGAGKSTIFEILLGFVRPQAGRVLLNGMEITTIMPQALSHMTAWIGQRPLLFAGTLRENIRFARPDAPDLEVEEAAHRARVSSFADTLPAGLETLIGEGGHGLSGGQAQRVAIARAFLKNAPLLLLDEPTAHLDPATEAEVLDSLRRLAIGRTVIVATHVTAAHGLSGRRIDLRQGRVVDQASARGAA